MSESSADPLFVEFLRQGPGADFEAFCRAHPQQTAHLREMYAAHERSLSQMRAAGLTAIPFPLGPSSSTLSESSPASGELLRRILAQGSKGARYRLRGEIARGGMGAILRVWDEDLGRELAMKVVLGSEGDSGRGSTPRVDERRVARFLEEAQITGQLDHPGVVPVHELGLDGQGHVYFTMRLVKGRDLGRILELVRSGEEGWNQTRALGVLLRVCEAMAYAHSKGVIHRDLKPANVMVGSYGEVYVMDWGLARVIGRADAHDLRIRDGTASATIQTARRDERKVGSDSPLVTMEGDVVGTPAYMPPEQARGRVEQISARSDVYAIGAMLYHLLSGQMPFVARGESKSNLDVLHALLHGAPLPLRRLREDVPPELEAICEKAMAREIPQRYANTLELAEDLRAYLEGRVVKAHETGAFAELRKWVARNKPLAAAAGLALACLVGGLIASLWQKSIADRNAALAAEKAAEATRQGDLALRNQTLAEQRAVEASAATQRAEAVRDFLSGMLSSANPLNSLQQDMQVSQVVDEAAKRLDAGEFAADPQTEFVLRNTLGDTYGGIGRFEEAERQLRQAAEILAKLPASDPLIAVQLELDLADTILARGAFAEAEKRARAATGILDAAQLEDPRSRSRAQTLLAAARYNQGSIDEAIALIRAAIETRGKYEDPGGQALARLRGKLAFYLNRKGSYDEALVEIEAVLDTFKDPAPGDYIVVTAALRERASIRMDKRHTKDALADLNEALRLREELLGPDNYYVADIVHDLALCELVLGMNEPALEHAQRALELRRKLFGDHRDTATALATMGTALIAVQQPEEARLQFEESLAMRRKVLPSDNPGIGDCLWRLGKLSRDQGELERAERLLREAMANWKHSLGEDHPDIAGIEIDLADVLGKRKKFAEARALLEGALASRVKTFGEISGGASEARDALATLLLHSGEWQDAEDLLRNLIPKLEAKLPAGHPLLAYTGAQLGAALVGQERLDEAEPLLLAAWKAIGEDPRVWAVNKLLILDNLITLHLARGDEAGAQTWREKAALLRQ